MIKNIDINNIIFKIIKTLPLKKLCFYINTFFCFCQQENYDKIRQITTEAIIPTASAQRDANNTNLVFFIFTELV